MQYFKVHFMSINVYADGKAEHSNAQNVILHNLFLLRYINIY